MPAPRGHAPNFTEITMTPTQTLEIAHRLLIRNRMGKTARRLVRTARRALRPDHVLFRGSILPPRDQRWCGPEFHDDTYYLQSSMNEAYRLVERLDCGVATRILDVGCGQGRLPIGLIRVLGDVDYTGADVHRPSIAWCRKHIERHHPSCRFHHIDVANERYNPHGIPLDEDFRFDVPANSIDIVYAYAVFSNMREADFRIYLRDFERILNDLGRVWFTAYVEDDVPDVSINPAGYVLDRTSGPLHVVRYERHYLFAILHELGYALEEFIHGSEVSGLSGILLRKRECPALLEPVSPDLQSSFLAGAR